MSLPNQQEFEQVLANILAPDNNIRIQAEGYFNAAKANPDYCVSSLLHTMRNSQQLELRSLACVLLKKCIAKTEDSLYPKLSPQVKEKVKTDLINALAEEKVDNIRSKLAYTVAGFVSGLIENGEYPEFIPLMFKWAASPDASIRESALAVFNQLATYLLNKGIAPYLTNIREMLTFCLSDNQNEKVRLAALEASSSVILILEKNQFAAFQDLIPLMLNCLALELNQGNIYEASSAIESLIEIAVSKASFFSKHATQVMGAMYMIAKTDNLDDSVRHLAMEFMISLIETAPSFVKKLPQFVDQIFPLCMNLMLDLEDEDEWSEVFEDDEMDLTNYDVGLESLDRLALSIGGSLVQPVAFKVIPQYLNQSTWKHKHAGLMAIAQTAEGCVEEYEAHLKDLVNMVLSMFKDEHPRVRYAAIHCAAQLSTDFSGQLQSQYHQLVMPALLGAMDDPVSKVQSHAATAIVNFVEDCENKYIQPYLNSILNKLLQLLMSGRRFVQEQSLSAISAVADCSEQLFQNYYDHIMPFLKQILGNATNKQDRMLRARAIECVSLIAVAVGKEKFSNDAMSIMECFIKTQQSNMENDDPQAHHLLQGWTRIARCMGQDFVPYLKFVMPSLLASANIKPEVVIADVDDDDQNEEEGMDSVTISIRGVGDKRISIRTSNLEEKALACSMLYSYVFELKDGFIDYVEEVAKIMVPLLKFAYVEEIRETSGTVMPQLLSCVRIAAEKKKADPAMIKQLLDFIFETMLESLSVEPEVRTATILVESLLDCIKVVGDQCLNVDQLTRLCAMLKMKILASATKRQELEKENRQEDDEEEQDRIDEDQMMEEQFLTTVAELVGGIMKSHSATFIPCFQEHLWDTYVNMLKPEYSNDEHRISLCVICDYVENSKGACVDHYKTIVPALLAYSQSDSAEVRQAAVYGLGACAQYGTDSYNPAVADSVRALITSIKRSDARVDVNQAATANAVSALFKFIQHKGHLDVCKPVELMPIFLESLPVGGDVIESKIVHENLVKMITANNPLVLGEASSNLPRLLRIFSEIVDTHLVNDETQKQIIQILNQLNSQPQMMQQAASFLTPDQISKLSKAIQRPAAE
ncbi:importin-beta [Acrasis kona]|uniref:Importin-beta n=1 Tax=Acrasis kona TaxID=1008807 RepID=A0AAW2YPE7_9EUKA